MAKILHITTNNKFISHALISFNKMYPGQNTVWMYTDYAGSKPDNNNFDLIFRYIDTFKPSLIKKIKEFDLVIIHGFDYLKYPIIAAAPKQVKFAWIGWGYDYNCYIYDNSSELLLEKTLLFKENNKKSKKVNLYSSFKNFIRKSIERELKKAALKRIGSFSPVLKEDYDLVKAKNILNPIPKYLPWNYGSIEDVFLKNYKDMRVSGESVLVGNSASLTNNHLDIFEVLNSMINSENYKLNLIVPLSYGDQEYRDKVIEDGVLKFKDFFNPIIEFIPLDEYVNLLLQCGYVIMNHVRQEAVGNIIIMLYLGARVFLREDNPTYIMLRNEGAFINTVDELNEKNWLIKLPLSEGEILKNIEVINKHWSSSAIDKKTKNLVECHLGVST